jgi:hypothetical protein
MNPFTFSRVCLVALLFHASPGAHAQSRTPNPTAKDGNDTPASFLGDSRAGYWLVQTDNLGVWWCESGWKIGRERGWLDKAFT